MKIICVGRNYARHAAEMNSAVPTEPVLFMKPSTALVINNKDFWHPDYSSNVHHEVELVLRVSAHGRSIAEKFAWKYYDAITVGLDLTARDIQKKCKEKGLPWEKAKAFDNSAPIGKWISKEEIKDMNDIGFYLKKDGLVVQEGNTKDLIFNFDFLISYISKFFTLTKGDLIFTGTPEGWKNPESENPLMGKLL
ncbi:oxaloacetate tautomerase FAHD1, mitochondrial-like [Stigmatopora argus]